VLVVDHNPRLEATLAERLGGTRIVPNGGRQGLSDARNSGIAATTQPIVAFLDDDAIPADGWLDRLVKPFDDPSIAIVGGHAVAEWQGGRPAWFPPEFLWVVGCSFVGQVTDGDVRNPLGCSMAMRRKVFEAVGGFDPDMGRLGPIPLGCEETELCLRYRSLDPGSRVVVVSNSVVKHRVGMARRGLDYFLRRCFYEGVSKAVLRGLATDQALSTEQRYVMRVLPRSYARNIARGVIGPKRLTHLGRAGSIAAGLTFTVSGYAAVRTGVLSASGIWDGGRKSSVVDPARDGTPSSRLSEPDGSLTDV